MGGFGKKSFDACLVEQLESLDLEGGSKTGFLIASHVSEESAATESDHDAICLSISCSAAQSANFGSIRASPVTVERKSRFGLHARLSSRACRNKPLTEIIMNIEKLVHCDALARKRPTIRGLPWPWTRHHFEAFHRIKHLLPLRGVRRSLGLVLAICLQHGTNLSTLTAQDLVVTDSQGISDYALYGQGGMWWDGGGVCGTEFPRNATIRVRAADMAYGTKKMANDCAILNGAYNNVVRDDLYIYYFGQGRLMRKALGTDESAGGIAFNLSSNSSIPLHGCLELADDTLYWGRPTSSDRLEIYSLKVDETTPVKLGQLDSAGVPIQKMKLTSYWVPLGSTHRKIKALVMLLEDGRLIRFSLRQGWFPASFKQLATGITDFALHTRSALFGYPNTNVYAAESQIDLPYTADPVPPGILWQIDLDGSSPTKKVYEASAVEQAQIFSVAADPGPSGMFFPHNVYISERPFSCDEEQQDVLFPCSYGKPRIRRAAFPISTINPTEWDLLPPSVSGVNLQSDGKRLYYQWTEGIYRVDSDVAPVEFDIQALDLEVTQAIQNLDGDMSLVARRSTPTYVRGYAFAPVNTTGQNTWFPDASLKVYLDGKEIDESPFSPINNASIDGNSGMSVLRPALNQSFLFELPFLEEGALTMTMTVNHNGFVPETGASPYSNNAVSLQNPIDVVESVAVCLNTYAMPTGAGTYTPDDGYLEIISRAESLLPARFLMSVQGYPGWSDVYFTDPDDEDSDNDALDKIDCIRKQTTSSGGSKFCKVEHWMGMVPPGVTGFNGIGRRPGSSLVVRMAEGGGGFPDPDSPRGGRTLAHELGHNYGRMHVDCGNPKNPDPNYPFAPCFIGNGSATGWWGFDPLTLSVINPTMVGDLMSYRGSRWTSTYTWGAILGRYQAINLLPAFLSVQPLLGANAAEENADAYLFVNGFIRPQLNTGVFRPFYTQPAPMIDPDILADDLAAGTPLRSETDQDLLRFLSSNGHVLGEYKIALAAPDDGEGQRLSFAQWVPFPPGSGRIQLRQNGITVAEQKISQNAPQLQLNGPVFDSVGETLSLSWNAFDSDGDDLFFNIYYSFDGGTGWNVLFNNYKGMSAVIDTTKLAGGAAAILRVSATDGVLTSSAETAPLVLPNNAPQVIMSGVKEGQQVPFGQALHLSSMALDPEDSGQVLPTQWTLTGPVSDTVINRTWVLRDLLPGSYQITLSATDSDGQTSSLSRNFEVAALVIPEGDAPRLDGFCNDTTYKNATFLRMPVGNGDYAPVRMIHAEGHLYVSFSGLRRNRFFAGSRVGLRVDADGSRNSLATRGDIGFFIDQDGIPSQEFGNGSGMVATQTPKLGFTAVVARGGSGLWSAEFKIADSLLGGWNHSAGIMFEHRSDAWPVDAHGDQPITWARAYFGAEVPSGSNLAPIGHAGTDQLVNLVDSRPIVLDGSSSHDPDGDDLSYSWVQVGGPPVDLSQSDHVNPSFIADLSESPSTLVFQLTVSDGLSTGAVDTVSVRLFPSTAPTFTGKDPQLPLTLANYRIEDGVFYAEIHGESGGVDSGTGIQIQASDDLNTWRVVWSGDADSNGVIEFRDHDSTDYEARYYRAAAK